MANSKSSKKLETKVYKQMKSGEKADEKVHKDIAKVLKHEKHESEKKEHHSKVLKPVSKAPKAKAKVEKVMHEFKEHKLHSGSKKGPEVTNPKQAIAIALSESRKAVKNKKKK